MSNADQRETNPEPYPYGITDSERSVIDRHEAKRDARRPAPRVKVQNGDISLAHVDSSIGTCILMEALGTTDHDFLVGLLDQLKETSTHANQVREVDFNFLLSVVKSVQPNNELEAMLAAQMAVVQIMVMRFSRHFSLAQSLPQQDSAERAFNKLARTFILQLEALRRHRTGGEQKVTVQHVSVGSGGQAIVGTVTQTAKAPKTEKPVNSTRALIHAPGTAMPPIGERESAPIPIKRRAKS